MWDTILTELPKYLPQLGVTFLGARAILVLA